MVGELEPRPENVPARPDPGRLRVSDDDRHRVAEILRQAAGEGRLDLQELDQRLEATYAAKTYAELVPLTSDLPAHRSQTPAVPSASSTPATVGPATQRHVAIMSRLDRSGEWLVPAHLKVTTFMGGAELDLRQATFAAREVVITINAFMGGARVVVGPHTNVVIEGTGFMGGYSGPSGLVAAELDDSSPTVRIRGLAVWGGVAVERKRLSA